MGVWKFYSSEDNLMILSYLSWLVRVLILRFSAYFRIHKFIRRWHESYKSGVRSNSRDHILTPQLTLKDHVAPS